MVASNKSDMINCIKVPTVFEKPTITVNIQGVTSSDLDELKSSDPFLYHSIQEAIVADAAAGVSQENRSSQSMVTRKTRFSFESHPDVLLENLVAAAAARTSEENHDSSDMATEPIPNNDEGLATEPNLYDSLCDRVLFDFFARENE